MMLQLRRAIERNETLAVAATAESLALVDQRNLIRALSRKSKSAIPLLILGVGTDTKPAFLKAWSGGATVGCKPIGSLRHPLYAVGRIAGLTSQLSDIHLPYPTNDTCYFDLPEISDVQKVMEVRDEHQAFPVFIKTAFDQRNVFLDSTKLLAPESAGNGNARSLLDAFAEIAPAMIFVRYSAGEWGWHSVHHYANLTIDDPWLREPYGNFSYKGLLNEMEKHDFHTTIAFIPWNYDRSEPEVVSLVRGHAERYSICIHGDNHDHQEFSDFQSKSLAVQRAALRESLNRMDRFQN